MYGSLYHYRAMPLQLDINYLPVITSTLEGLSQDDDEVIRGEVNTGGGGGEGKRRSLAEYTANLCPSTQVCISEPEECFE